MPEKNDPKTDPGKFWFQQETARTAEMDSHQAVEKVWGKIVSGEISTTIQAGVLRMKSDRAPGEETDGEKMMRLWGLRGMPVERVG